MKKILFVAAMAAVVAIGSQNSHSNSGGAPAASTGFDGESTCLRCHAGNLAGAAAPGTFEIFTSNADTAYVPGQTYTFTVRLTGGTASVYGFQVKSVSATNVQRGSFTSGTGNRVVTTGGRSYITHAGASGTGTWTFNWTAPAAGSGTVFFRGIIFNGASNGDPGALYYRREFGFKELVNSSTAKAIKLNDLSVYPNPATEGVNIDFAMSDAGNIKAGLFAITGQEVASQDFGKMGSGNHNLRFNFNKNLSKGVYVLQVRSGSSYTSKTLRID